MTPPLNIFARPSLTVKVWGTLWAWAAVVVVGALSCVEAEVGVRVGALFSVEVEVEGGTVAEGEESIAMSYGRDGR